MAPRKRSLRDEAGESSEAGALRTSDAVRGILDVRFAACSHASNRENECVCPTS
jgi:hypothetical protein